MDIQARESPASESWASRRAKLVERLQAILPSASILSETEELRPYECDGLSAYRKLPGVVCLAETVEQVQSVLRLCHELQVPVVPRGAGTGLSGGALPHEEGLLLGLAKMGRILDIDVDNRCAVVQPGVRNQALSEASRPYGLYYAPDPSSQIACTIGGNVAENSGGVHCLKYGLTVHNVIGLKVVTIEGELLEIGGKTLDTPGYDLLALYCGSEGLLGVVVEITVRLLSLPERAQVVLAAFDDVEKAGQAVADIIAAGIIPAGLEMMDRLAIRAVEDFVHANYPTNAAAILLCELDGANAEVSESIMHVRQLMIASGAFEVRTAKDEAERLAFWKGRKAAFPAVGRIAPDYYCMDGTIPRRSLPKVLKHIAELSEKFGLPVANVFHAGDGNLHPLILYDANRRDVNGVPELAQVEELGGRIMELCISVGGTITGEHGVGVEKLDGMCEQFQPTELRLFHAVKAAFDSDGLLNPGKAVPSLHRCSEFGAMHVHHGQLSYPELERF
ncbi:MAG TPA: FAD-linked oxidase C-terminal domain-containing protein [Methylophilaceae bacterium]|nr:FAD-linked oxidase C-terminal domain-containing protein [Methylophilaceae bacterium]